MPGQKEKRPGVAHAPPGCYMFLMDTFYIAASILLAAGVLGVLLLKARDKCSP